jgi:hypothetical protein
VLSFTCLLSKAKAVTENNNSTVLDNKQAIYEFNNGIKSWFITEDNIYIVQDWPMYGERPNNAVYAINTTTGKVSTIVSGMNNGQYEGGRKKLIHGVIMAGDELALQVKERKFNDGFPEPVWKKYDQQTGNLSDFFNNYNLTDITNYDDYYGSIYMMCSIEPQNNYDASKKWKSVLWNTQSGQTKDMGTHDIGYLESLYLSEGRRVIDRRGTQWLVERIEFDEKGELSQCYDRQKVALAYITLSGKEGALYLNRLDYVRNENPDVSMDQVGLYMCGDMLYFNYGRRIYQVDTSVDSKDYKITEFLKIPINMPGKFNPTFMVSSNGAVLTDEINNATKWKLVYFSPSDYNNPKIIERDGGDNKFSLLDKKCKTDQSGNFIIFYGNRVHIYNPEGVNGYVGGKGKVTKVGY